MATKSLSPLCLVDKSKIDLLIDLAKTILEQNSETIGLKGKKKKFERKILLKTLTQPGRGLQKNIFISKVNKPLTTNQRKEHKKNLRRLGIISSEESKELFTTFVNLKKKKTLKFILDKNDYKDFEEGNLMNKYVKIGKKGETFPVTVLADIFLKSRRAVENFENPLLIKKTIKCLKKEGVNDNDIVNKACKMMILK